ncbi:cytochrome d ubiquinol oxidase subunit II [Coxiella-like endosymbiont]|uniref:cytochrome d ubiquinol oxidase subunit II n=1 Tax=Coxiella-like endosymbiont TaxID=1592897 RepID=UPI00272C30A5|nr:cytochrome d ubiquinol oxidase subunit II [Coxiella-like endosymbiont]
MREAVYFWFGWLFTVPHFSRLYFIFLFIVWAFGPFLRLPAYDYGGKLSNHIWHRLWDWVLFISSIVPVFFFGVAFGNYLLGLLFYFDPVTFRDYYTGSFLISSTDLVFYWAVPLR